MSEMYHFFWQKVGFRELEDNDFSAVLSRYFLSPPQKSHCTVLPISLGEGRRAQESDLKFSLRRYRKLFSITQYKNPHPPCKLFS